MDRKKGIGGTDISAIVGLNPWKTPLDVFLEKTGQKEDQPDNENMWWGREMEPVLAMRYWLETGHRLFIPDPEILPYRSSLAPFVCGSPDALVNVQDPIQGISEAGVDFKTSGKPSEWGEPGTDEIPEQYIIQAEWYMGLTGAEWWDIAVLLMGFSRKFSIYRVNRDKELIENLIEAGGKFWTDHVLAGVAPALDGSKTATEYIKRLYPTDSGPMLEPTDEAILETIREYRDTIEYRKTIENTEATLANQLKDFVKDFSGMQGPWGKITWRKAKDSQVVDWKNLAMSFLPSPEDMQKFTIIKSGSRRWLPKFNQED